MISEMTSCADFSMAKAASLTQKSATRSIRGEEKRYYFIISTVVNIRVTNNHLPSKVFTVFLKIHVHT